MRLMTHTDDQALLIAEEYRDLNLFRRWVLRMLAPRTARYAKWLAANMPAIQTGPMYPPQQPDTRGPAQRWGDRVLG